MQQTQTQFQNGMTASSFSYSCLVSSSAEFRPRPSHFRISLVGCQSPFSPLVASSSLCRSLRISSRIRASASRSMETLEPTASAESNPPMKLLFVEMGVGYDQHGQNVTAAAMRACRDAISSNSIPAFRKGSIPGVTFEQMKLHIKLGVPHSLQQSLDIEKVKSVFPYGKILDVEVVDGGLICSSGVQVEEMGDKNEDCYIVNSAVYVGY